MLQRLTGADIEANLQSLRDVPAHVLPAGPERDALVKIATLGLGVDAYASGGPRIGTWFLWIEALADARRHVGRDGRVTISEWRHRWRELMAEIARHLAGTGDPADAEAAWALVCEGTPAAS